MITPERFRHMMWYTFAGTKGGSKRIRLVTLLKDRPYNAHQLAKSLGVDYRTILHHLKVLEDNQFIQCDGRHYGEVYYLSSMFSQEMEAFEGIVKKLNLGAGLQAGP